MNEPYGYFPHVKAARFILGWSCMLALRAAPLHAQDAAIDSLSTVFERSSDVNARLAAGRQLAIRYTESEPQRALIICDRAGRMIDSLLAAKAVDDSTALKYRFSFLHYTSNAYGNLGDTEAQLRTGLKRLKLAQTSGSKSRESSALTAIGMMYADQGYRDDARAYYRRAMDIDEELGDSLSMAISIGNLVSTMGFDHPDTNLRYYHRALELMRGTRARETSGSIAWMMNNIGSVHQEIGNLDSAYRYYMRSLAIRDSIDHRYGQYLAHRSLADLLLQQGRLTEALVHANASVRISEQNGFRDNYKSYANRSAILARLGRPAEALQDHIRFTERRDSIVSEGNTKQLVQQAMRYEYGRQHLADSLAFQAELRVKAEEVRRQKVVRNGFMGGFALVAVFAIVFLFQRNRISKARKRSDELLLNILPEEVAEELKANGEAEAVHIDQVTVLFTDFKGFTAMSEVVTPRQLVHDLHECFSAFDRIAEKYGIEKIKTIGDAYMAAGGLPTPNTTHATDVINAAFEMRDFIAEGKARKVAAGLPYFEIRIGVHTGPVVAGIVGVKKFSYDIWGDTVNTASRMESSGAVGQVNISETTHELVKDDASFSFTARGKVQAKGKGEMEMYFVERA